MKKLYFPTLWAFLALVGVLLLNACQVAAAVPSTVTATMPTPLASFTVTPPLGLTATSTPTASSTPTTTSIPTATSTPTVARTVAITLTAVPSITAATVTAATTVTAAVIPTAASDGAVTIAPISVTPLVPSGTNGPSPSPVAPGMKVVTLADSGRSIVIPRGSRFLLDLGGTDWTVRVADPSIVSRVPNIAVIRGAQGVYEAHQLGQTTITATGAPPCRTAHPPCAIADVTFQVTIVVRLPAV